MEYEKEYYKKVYTLMEKNERYYVLRSKISLKRYFSLIHDIFNKKVLEFGCGLGQNIFLLKNKFGYDSSKYSLDFCKRKGILVFSSEKSIPKAEFDVVLCSHALEHVENPLETLKVIREKLKKEGTLILVIPKEDHKKYRKIDKINYHLYSWNFQTIANLLDKAGFAIIKTKEYRGSGYNKLSFVNRIDFNLYEKAVSALGRIFDIGELVIFCKKSS